MSSSRYDTTLAAISFFSFDADTQISIVERHFDQEIPAMFWGERKMPRYSDVLVSIACIYYTARGGFVDKYDEDNEIFDLYEDFHHRVTCMLGEGEKEWSVEAVRCGYAWARLRQETRKLLNSIGYSPDLRSIRFNLLQEFNPAEFVTTKEQSEYIDYLLSSPENNEPGNT